MTVQVDIMPDGTPVVTGGGNGDEGGIIDHGTLRGLGDDDHPQYLLRDEHEQSEAPLAGSSTSMTDGTPGLAIYAKDSDTTSTDKAATPAGVATQIVGAVGGEMVPEGNVLNIYADPNGNDTNSGLILSDPVKTLNGAFGIINKLNLTKGRVRICLAHGGIFKATAIGNAVPIGGIFNAARIPYDSIIEISTWPAPGTSSNLYAKIQADELNDNLAVFGGQIYFKYIRFECTVALMCHCYVQFLMPYFVGNSNSPTYALYASNCSRAHILDRSTFSGIFESGLYATALSQISLTFPSTTTGATFNNAFLVAGDRAGPGTIATAMIQSNIASGSFTGKRYAISNGGMITGMTKAALDAIPGSIAGTIDSTLANRS